MNTGRQSPGNNNQQHLLKEIRDTLKSQNTLTSTQNSLIDKLIDVNKDSYSDFTDMLDSITSGVYDLNKILFDIKNILEKSNTTLPESSKPTSELKELREQLFGKDTAYIPPKEENHGDTSGGQTTQQLRDQLKADELKASEIFDAVKEHTGNLESTNKASIDDVVYEETKYNDMGELVKQTYQLEKIRRAVEILAGIEKPLDSSPADTTTPPAPASPDTTASSSTLETSDNTTTPPAPASPDTTTPPAPPDTTTPAPTPPSAPPAPVLPDNTTPEPPDTTTIENTTKPTGGSPKIDPRRGQLTGHVSLDDESKLYFKDMVMLLKILVGKSNKNERSRRESEKKSSAIIPAPLKSVMGTAIGAAVGILGVKLIAWLNDNWESTKNTITTIDNNIREGRDPSGTFTIPAKLENEEDYYGLWGGLGLGAAAGYFINKRFLRKEKEARARMNFTTGSGNITGNVTRGATHPHITIHGDGIKHPNAMNAAFNLKRDFGTIKIPSHTNAVFDTSISHTSSPNFATAAAQAHANKTVTVSGLKLTPTGGKGVSIGMSPTVSNPLNPEVTINKGTVNYNPATSKLITSSGGTFSGRDQLILGNNRITVQSGAIPTVNPKSGINIKNIVKPTFGTNLRGGFAGLAMGLLPSMIAEIAYTLNPEKYIESLIKSQDILSPGAEGYIDRALNDGVITEEKLINMRLQRKQNILPDDIEAGGSNSTEKSSNMEGKKVNNAVVARGGDSVSHTTIINQNVDLSDYINMDGTRELKDFQSTIRY